MGKVKFELSVEKIVFKFEGDSGTGQAVNRAMNHTLGSLMEAQNRVIDVTPEPPQAALPPVSVPNPRRRHRSRPKAVPNGQPPNESPPTNGESVTPKSARQRRSHGSSFRDQAYLLIREGYFSQRRTANELNAELSRRGHHFDRKNVASDLLQLVKKQYLSRDHNENGKYAYVKGMNDDLPAGQGGS